MAARAEVVGEAPTRSWRRQRLLLARIVIKKTTRPSVHSVSRGLRLRAQLGLGRASCAASVPLFAGGLGLLLLLLVGSLKATWLRARGGDEAPDAGIGEAEQLVHLGAREWRSFGRSLHLD